MTSADHVLAVDAGGTKTDALVVSRDGAVAGCVRLPGANHESLGWEESATRLRRTVDEVLAAAGITRSDIVASGWGLAGLDWPADQAAYREIVAGIGFVEKAVVVNDAFLALEAGEAAGVGVAVVSGTGVVVVGRREDGRTERTLGVTAGRGSWGSGRDVVRAAVEAMIQQEMGLEPDTVLTAVAVERAGADSLHAYFEEVWRHGRMHLAPPDVWEAAASGDRAAQQIAARVADSLAAGAGVVARRLGMVAPDVVLTGRVLDPGHPYLHRLVTQALDQTLPGCRPRRLGVPPVVGAVHAAARAAGWPPLAVRLDGGAVLVGGS